MQEEIKARHMGYQSYKSLEIYQQAHKLAVEIHEMSLQSLPAFEKYEEGSQIRRSSKSAVANMVEGFGMRRYVKEFIRYLTLSHASTDETKEHLEILYETKSLRDKELFIYFLNQYEELGRKIYAFIRSVQKQHMVKVRE